jgi:acyl-CoA synthetase (AMP-forming)/AMP-acid ligase II
MSLSSILTSSDATALIQGNISINYSQLIKQVENAASLIASKTAPGDYVGMAFANNVEFVVSFLGIMRAGRVAAPLNPGYTKDEFTFYLEDTGSTVVLVPKIGNEACQLAASALGLPILQTDFQDGQLTISSTQNSTLPAEPSPEAVALFLHTSGTTSRPKGVPLSHGNLVASITNIIKTYELTSQDKTYIVMPLFHVHGLMCALLSTLATQGTCILPDAGKFSAGHFWKDVDDQKVTWYTAVPTIHQILLSRWKGKQEDAALVARAIGRLRFIRSCSSALVPAVFHDLEEAFKAPVLEAYAMSEASHQMCSNPLPKFGERKPGTVGKPTGIKLSILSDDGMELPIGQVGQVCIQGPNVMKGYRNNPQANKDNFVGPWFCTGDRGKLDNDGYLTLTGRIKELINRGGEKISPLEVDAALLQHPLINEAVAFAMPDAKYGEEVAAAVVLLPDATLTPDQIQDFLKDKLAPFKIPKKIFIAKDMVRTATGKIQRRFVAEHFLST